MSTVDIAKELLRKGIAMGDPELIAMANQLLPEEKSKPTKKPKASKAPETKPAIITSLDEVEPFSRPNNIETGRRPARWSGNTWSDTGELGELGKEALTTPDIKLSQRSRPKYEKIEVLCTSCNKSVKTDPVHKTEFFKCDRCLRKLSGGK